MRKLLLTISLGLLMLSGCQQISDQAENIKKQTDQTINKASQEAIETRDAVIKAKQKYEEKSQQLVNTVDAINKLTN